SAKDRRHRDHAVPCSRTGVVFRGAKDDYGAGPPRGGGVMNLLLLGVSFKNTPIDLREKLAFDGPRLPAALEEMNSRYGCEAAILSTCNRVEVYLARPQASLDADLLLEFLGETHRLPVDLLKSHLYQHRDRDVIHHLFRVAASLDSLIVGEGQIAG